MIERQATLAGVEPPSVNQVRRRVGAWYRRQLRDRIGPLLPPVSDLPSRLAEIGKVGAELAPRLEAEARRIVQELIEQENGKEPAPPRPCPPIADGDAGA
jgi:hypothetical protein